MAVEKEKLENTQRDLMNQEEKGGAGAHADQHDGSVHDPVYYKGKLVEYVKDVGVHDQGYDGNKRQVMIIDESGKQRVVAEADILRERKTAPAPLEIDRHPERPFNPNAPRTTTAGSTKG